MVRVHAVGKKAAGVGWLGALTVGALAFLPLSCARPESADPRARAATAVADAASAAALAHGVLTEAVDNPATALSSLQYDCIAREAATFWPGFAYSFEVPPALTEIRGGPPAGTNPAGDELRFEGPKVQEVTAGSLITLHGREFGFLKEHNAVTIGEQPAPRSSRVSRSVMAVIVPLFDIDEPRDMEVRVLVRGVPSNVLTLRVLPARSPETAPFILAKRVIQKEYAFTRAVAATDWPSLLATTTERLDPFEKKDILAAADRLVACARDLEEQLKVFETELNRHARFLELDEQVLHGSPAVESLLDRANEILASTPSKSEAVARLTHPSSFRRPDP